MRLLETADGHALFFFVAETETALEHVLRDALDPAALLRDGFDGATLALIRAPARGVSGLPAVEAGTFLQGNPWLGAVGRGVFATAVPAPGFRALTLWL